MDSEMQNMDTTLNTKKEDKMDQLKYNISFIENVQGLEGTEDEEFRLIKSELKSKLYTYLNLAGFEIQGDINLDFDMIGDDFIEGDIATANKGSHEFKKGEDLMFIGLDTDENLIEAHVFMSKQTGVVNWLVDGDFSWSN